VENVGMNWLPLNIAMIVMKSFIGDAAFVIMKNQCKIPIITTKTNSQLRREQKNYLK
jgi:hypothetical protein